MQKSEILKIQAENEQLRAELLKATVKLDCALESNAALSAQMTDLQEVPSYMCRRDGAPSAGKIE